MKRPPIWSATTCAVLALSLVLLAQAVSAQPAPAPHTIFVNAVEYKGTTTTEKLAPPGGNPATLRKGYTYKAPGEADKTAPQNWEVDS